MGSCMDGLRSAEGESFVVSLEELATGYTYPRPEEVSIERLYRQANDNVDSDNTSILFVSISDVSLSRLSRMEYIPV